MNEYGEPIGVDGVRPEWLRDDERALLIGRSGQTYGKPDGYVVSAVPEFDIFWHQTKGIRLPVEHPYYLVARYNAEHGTSFVYWPGGDEAPGDWDGKTALRSDGALIYAPLLCTKWDKSARMHIIGYLKRQPTTLDTETVTLRKMSEAEALKAWNSDTATDDMENGNWHVELLRRLGLIRTPTRAETIAAKSGVAVDVVERVLGAMGDE